MLKYFNKTEFFNEINGFFEESNLKHILNTKQINQQ